MSEPFFKESDCDVHYHMAPGIDYKKPVITIEKANAMVKEFLDKGVVVYQDSSMIIWSELLLKEHSKKTALLINIEPVEKPDSAEKIVEDLLTFSNETHLVEYKGKPPSSQSLYQLIDRARRLKDRK